MILPELGLAQCPMCRGAAESSLKEGKTTAAGLNKGIYTSLPFLIPWQPYWVFYGGGGIKIMNNLLTVNNNPFVKVCQRVFHV